MSLAYQHIACGVYTLQTTACTVCVYDCVYEQIQWSLCVRPVLFNSPMGWQPVCCCTLDLVHTAEFIPVFFPRGRLMPTTSSWLCLQCKFCVNFSQAAAWLSLTVWLHWTDSPFVCIATHYMQESCGGCEWRPLVSGIEWKVAPSMEWLQFHLLHFVVSIQCPWM